MCTFAGGARTDLDENGIAIRSIDQAVAVRHAGFPCRSIAGLEHGLALVLTKHDFALQDIDELVFLLVPMALRGCRTRRERTDIDAKMREADGTAKPFARAAFDHLVEGRRITGSNVDRNLVDIDLRHQTRSIMVAVPMPTPMQSVISAVALSRRSSSSRTVPRIMAPVAPSG